MQFSDEERKTIWYIFWDLNYTSRRNWLSKTIKIEEVKRRKSNEIPGWQTRDDSRYFFLPKNNIDVQVCRSFFLKTLGFKNDSIITELSKSIKRKQL